MRRPDQKADLPAGDLSGNLASTPAASAIGNRFAGTGCGVGPPWFIPCGTACFIASATTEQPCSKAGSDHNRCAGHRDGGHNYGYGGDGGTSIRDVGALD